jgi:hypothetical protein
MRQAFYLARRGEPVHDVTRQLGNRPSQEREVYAHPQHGDRILRYCFML